MKRRKLFSVADYLGSTKEGGGGLPSEECWDYLRILIFLRKMALQDVSRGGPHKRL